MVEYRIEEREIGDELFYCVFINEKIHALFKNSDDARTFIATTLNKVRDVGARSAPTSSSSLSEILEYI